MPTNCENRDGQEIPGQIPLAIRLVLALATEKRGDSASPELRRSSQLGFRQSMDRDGDLS